MKVVAIQHVEFETPGLICNWAEQRQHELKILQAEETNFEDEELQNFDLLVLMGGPMSIHDEDTFAWLKNEKEFINNKIAAGKKIIGFCLGAQLLADCLGAKVYKNQCKEIGFFPVKFKEEALNSTHFKDTGLISQQDFFHWHGETFDIPHKCVHLASSAHCMNQAFSYEERVFAFQFHPEATPETVELLIQNSADELKELEINLQDNAYHKPIRMKELSRVVETRSFLFSFLDSLLQRNSNKVG